MCRHCVLFWAEGFTSGHVSPAVFSVHTRDRRFNVPSEAQRRSSGNVNCGHPSKSWGIHVQQNTLIYFFFTAQFESSGELKYIRWVQALTKEDDQHPDISDSSEESDQEDGDDDGEELQVAANKFVPLGG